MQTKKIKGFEVFINENSDELIEDLIPETPHKYQVGDHVKFMKSDYETEEGEITKLDTRHMNTKPYNVYVITSSDGGKEHIVDEVDILDPKKSFPTSRFYNPD